MSYTKCQEADDETDGYWEGKREYEEENFGGIESDSYGTALSENQRETKFCQQRTSLEENVKTEQEAGGEMEREQEEERVDVFDPFSFPSASLSADRRGKRDYSLQRRGQTSTL